MAVKSLQVLYGGSDHIDKRRIIHGLAKEAMVDTAFLNFLIRTDEGNILVDAGLHPADVEMMNAGGFKANVRPEDHLPQRLREVGLSMEDINMVLITHLHIDHGGWLAHLPNAEVILQKEEYQFTFDPPPYARGSSGYVERLKSQKIKWRMVDGDHVLMPGITILFTPGHTPGSQSVMVDLPKFGAILLVGDAGPLQENFAEELIPSFFGDPMQAWYSIRRLKVWSQIRKAPIFTSHDLDFWRREMIKPPEAYT